MKTFYGLCVFFLLACSLLTYGQQPAANSPAQTNVYTNDALGLTWEYPKNWVAQKEPGEPPPGRMKVLLDLATPNGDSVAMVSEDYKDTPGFGVHYSDSLKDMLVQQGWESFGERRDRTLGGGLHVVEDRFKSKTPPANYLAVICGDLRGYELKFMIETGGPSDLDAIGKVLDNVKVKPDWTSTEKSEGAGDASQVTRIPGATGATLITKNVPPEYPEEARTKKISGSVVMLAHLNTAGRLQDLYVVEGHPLLVPAALKAASQWEFKPYLVNEQPVNVETQIMVNFSLPK